MPIAPTLLLSLAALLLTPSCYGTRKLYEPTVRIQGDGGSELGVSTDYGVVFLGRQVRAGYVELTAWFGDGPSIESTVVEPVGGGLYTAETEIRLPSVPIHFEALPAGASVQVRGREGEREWTRTATVAEDPAVYGLLLRPGPGRGLGEDQVGAGVYVGRRGDRELVGLISGRIRISGPDGTREYLTVVGAQELWRLVTHRRDQGRRRPFVYRQDIL